MDTFLNGFNARNSSLSGDLYLLILLTTQPPSHVQVRCLEFVLFIFNCPDTNLFIRHHLYLILDEKHPYIHLINTPQTSSSILTLNRKHISSTCHLLFLFLSLLSTQPLSYPWFVKRTFLQKIWHWLRFQAKTRDKQVKVNE